MCPKNLVIVADILYCPGLASSDMVARSQTTVGPFFLSAVFPNDLMILRPMTKHHEATTLERDSEPSVGTQRSQSCANHQRSAYQMLRQSQTI